MDKTNSGFKVSMQIVKKKTKQMRTLLLIFVYMFTDSKMTNILFIIGIFSVVVPHCDH